MSPKTILVVGSLNMDQVVQVPRLPTLGETVLGAGALTFVAGGKGANQAVAMARMGASVMMAGRVGKDFFGEQLLNSLRADKINTELIAVDEEQASGVAFIFLAHGGDNAIIVAPGANMRVGQDQTHFAAILEAISQVSALVLQLEIPLETVKAFIAAGHKAGIPVVLNLAPAQRLPWETLRQLQTLIVNEAEASLLSERSISTLEDARVVAGMLHGQGIPIVIVTLGVQGAVLASDDERGNARVLHQVAPEVQVVDTTAAGDCFVGAFTFAQSEGRSLEQALRFAVGASALKVTKFGAQSGLPLREQVDAFWS